jgi:hypothetical protein
MSRRKRPGQKDWGKELVKACVPIRERPENLDSTAEDVASESDRQWFDAHPRRNYRVRRAFSRELGNYPQWVVVFQIGPGFRVRMPIRLDITDEHIELMQEHGTFDLVDGMPVWIPDDCTWAPGQALDLRPDN